MEIKIDGYPSDYFVGSKLIGFDSAGNRTELKNNMDNFVTWSSFPTVVVLDSSGNEVMLNTDSVDITGLIVV